MNLVVILGSGAVGKMTVGQELQKITDYRLFHNHMMIEPVLEIFGGFQGGLVNKLRDVIMDTFIETDFSGLIVTYMMAFDFKSEWDYINSLKEKFEATGGDVYFVELVADQEERLRRNATENRLTNKASKRDIVVSNGRLMHEDSNYRLVSNEGEFPYENYIKIDNTNLEPDVVARMVKDRFNLEDYCYRDVLNQFMISPVREDEIELYAELQRQSFMPLYEKYHDDETSPALETVEHIKNKYNDPDRIYHFIRKNGAIVGGVNIDLRQYDDGKGFGRVSPIFILPEHQNKGNGYIAMLKILNEYNHVKYWRLETIKEEQGNCRLYEKLGFNRVDDELVINEKLTLVYYELLTKI